jgi:Arc/MetJ-type ribon-helix-helix transcriptional regulator
VTRKPRVVTFRLDQATWDRMRELVPYTKYRNASSFVRAAHPYLPQSQTL